MAVTSASEALSYDVFLNFRGPDTRHGFTGYLRDALRKSGIIIFIDDDDLKRGNEITPALKEAIEKSNVAITVFSENYASSLCCLYELAYILKCRREKGLLVLPVFYKVSPTDVRSPTGCYGKALDKLKLDKKFQRNIDGWKKDLAEAAGLAGLEFNDGTGYEYEFVGKIVEQVFSEINHDARIYVADCQVQLGSQVSKIRELLDVERDAAAHIIGIHGMGGVGKSTLARQVYNLITGNFEVSCFLQNVREESNKHGLTHLQSILLSQILGKMEINLASEQQGTSMIQNRLKGKKVLLILDDVDKHKQLQAIVGKPDWFGPGSRVIITTRDKQLLASHDVKKTYEMKELDEVDARQLLEWKAFKKNLVDPSYKVVLNHVVSYASGLPLALEVIGSNLFGKSIEEWESAIKKYKRIPNNQILDILSKL